MKWVRLPPPAPMKKTVLRIVLMAILMVTAAAIVLVNRRSVSPPESVTPLPSGEIIVVGKMECLPHKDTDGPQTLECAFGLKDAEGRYFALRDSDPNYQNLSSAPMGVVVEVEGIFTPRDDSIYQDIGVVEVRRISVL